MKHLTCYLLLCLLLIGCKSQMINSIQGDLYPEAGKRVVSEDNVTYYINPVSGRDENVGTRKEAPWKTFKKINQLILTKGNNIEILSPGIFRESLYVIGQGTLESPITIQFAPGEYNFYPEKGFKSKFNISNTNDAPDSLKTVAFYFLDSKYIDVKGNGAEIVFRGKVIEASLNNCENINIEQLKFDYKRPTVSEVTVLSARDSFADVQIHEDSKYEIVDSTLVWVGEGWKHKVHRYWQVFDGENQKVSRSILPVGSMRFSALAQQQVRIHFDKNPGFTKGLTYQNRNTFRDYAAIFMQKSKNISLRDVRIYFMHGMGIVSQFCEDITIDSLTVKPREGSGRTCAAWADILHFSGCKGEILVDNSFLSASNDDAVNVHGTHLQITKTLADRKVQVRFVHPQTYGFDPFAVGDSIEFIRVKSLLPYSKNKISQVQKLNDKEFELTLNEDVPDNIQTDDVIENITWTPDVTIRNTKIVHIPTRGILVTTRGKVFIENNELINTEMSGILIADDAAGWFESGYVRDVTIRNNKFIGCGSPVINIHPENSEIVDGIPVHRNIQIVNNKFVTEKGVIVSANSTGNIKFLNNVIESDKHLDINDFMIFKDCSDFEVEGNQVNNAVVKGEGNPLEELIRKQHVVFTAPPKKIPVSYSVDAPMLGNGFTGIALSGKPEKQVYYLARNDFWRLKSSLNESFPAVLGKLEINIPEMEGASYLVEQSLYDAKTYSSFSKDGGQVNFKSYISAVEDLAVIEITWTGETELNGSVKLKLPGKEEFVDKPPVDLLFPSVTDEGKTAGSVHYISRAFEEGVDIPTKAAAAFSILDNGSNSFQLSKTKPVYILLAFSSNFKSDDCVQSVTERLKGIQQEDLAVIEGKHEEWWGDFWSKSHVNLNDSIIEKQYYLSNYTMASFSRDENFPPSIFGTCITKERPNWNGDYHLNYNHYAPYYGLFSSNHVEQAFPSNMPLLAAQKRGEYYSEKVGGVVNGVMLPVGIGPLGIETTRRNDFVNSHRTSWIENGDIEDEGLFFGQKSNSSYAVVNMARHFYTTYDEEYTKKYYPFVKGVATFWEKYLTFENGRYVVYNDAIHEGTIGTVNPILSLGLIPLVMESAIDMSVELKEDPERRAKWQHIIDHLSEYTTQEKEGKTVFRYSEKGTDWWGDNTLGIQHIYPAGRIGLDSDPELLKIAFNTIDVMQRWIDFNGSNSFFPASVRVGYNADTILHHLGEYSKNTYSNGFQLNNPHGIENLSTVPNTINEMLCMGHENVVRVFPVWPKTRGASFSNLRTDGAFLVSSELKDGEVQFIEVISEKGKTLNLLNPWDGRAVIVRRSGGETESFEGNRLVIETSAGEKLLIKPGKT